MQAEDKIFSLLGKYVYEATLRAEEGVALKAEIERLKEIINKKEE